MTPEAIEYAAIFVLGLTIVMSDRPLLKTAPQVRHPRTATVIGVVAMVFGLAGVVSGL